VAQQEAAELLALGRAKQSRGEQPEQEQQEQQAEQIAGTGTFSRSSSAALAG
jgi:hypothetical protein